LEVRPVTTEQGSYPPVNFSGVRRPELFVTKVDILKAINDDNLFEASYIGEVNTH
jgi:thiosulfate/3-mercaptopyruvate sulfurtransferase